MKTLFALFLSFIALNSFAAISASSAKLVCHTPRLDKAFVVGATQVTFLDESLPAPERQLASIDGIRTKISGNGFTKIVSFEGQRHTIHVANVASPSQVEDYLVIRSREGHELTYPLDCSAVN
tara:strand:+ start:14873 stop:15241 length:369 start_codon:yes stop_codon:yes gene_type:complete